MGKKITILFLIPTLGHGGAEKVLVNLVNNMNNEKYDITVQTMFDMGVNRKYLRKEIKYIGGFPYYFRGNTIVYKLFSSKTLYKMYVKRNYDIIVSYLEGPSARVVSGCTKETSKLITWIHTALINKKYAFKSFRSEKEANDCYRRFNKIICVSNTVKQNFEHIFPIGVPIDVLYNTVETDKIRLKQKEPIDDVVYSNDFNICSVAKLMKIKGFDRLVRIQKKLFDNGIRTHIYILGIGEEKSNLERLLAECGMTNYWTFLGYKENPYKYVSNADLYVCPSIREGFSTAVTEALVTGTPVVSTNCSGAYELLGYHNEYGIVTDNDEDALYEGIKKMLTVEGLLNHYRKKAAERGRYFCTAETVKKVENMLEEVMHS